MIPDSVNRQIEETIGLSPEVFHEHHLEFAIHARMSLRGIQHREVYQDILEQECHEVQELAETIFAPTTWFHRHPHAYSYLSDWLKETLQTHLQKTPSNKIRILSFPCSTGEEVYSITMAFLEAGFSSDKLHLEGCDTRTDLLEKAKEGVYGANSFDDMQPELFEKYFGEDQSGRWKIRKDLQAIPQFRQLNPFAIEQQAQSENCTYDIIFCRNILVYLNPEHRRKLLHAIRQHLHKEGMLFAGRSDNVSAIDSRYQLVSSAKGAYAYTFNPAPSSTAHTETYKEVTPQQEVSDCDAINCSREDTLTNARELVENGFHEEAEMICEEWLSSKGPHPELFYLLGRIYAMRGYINRSEEAFHKCIYLENGHLAKEAFEALEQMSKS